MDATLTRDTDGHNTKDCDIGDWSAQVRQENLPVVKQKLHDVCITGCVLIQQEQFTIIA